MLLSLLSTALLEIEDKPGQRVTIASEGVIRAGEGRNRASKDF